MNKKILIVLLLIFISTSCNINKNNIDNNNSSGALENTNSWSNDLTNWETNPQNDVITKKKNSIEELRKKLALKWLILKWDISLENGDYTSALVKYLQIHKELPNDESIIQKLWDVNYNLKKFDKAYSYYSQIKWYDRLDRDLAARTLISSGNLSNENIQFIIKELDTLWLNEEQLIYYKTALECKIDFSECRKEYQDYFTKRKNDTTNTWSGSTNSEIKFEALANIKKSIDNYENFQLDDLHYKWALVAWAFFENGLYPIAIETSKNILNNKNDYKPLLKIIAKSYFELWNYVQAKLYLIEYSNIVQDDEEVSFFLWVVYERLHEYVLSTIHLNKAIDLWYNNTLDVYKRVLYNYNQLWEMDKMLETFNNMFNKHKETMSIDDYNLAIYYSLINDKNKEAKEFTSYAITKYPNSEIFNWYMWWILMNSINSKPIQKAANNSSTWSTDISENNKEYINKLYAESEKYIDKWLELNSKSPMLNMVKWKLEISKWDYKKAFLYLTKTVSLDLDWEFWTMAKSDLENIKINK